MLVEGFWACRYFAAGGSPGKRSGCLGSLPRSRQYSSRCQSENRIDTNPRTTTRMAMSDSLAISSGNGGFGMKVRTSATASAGNEK